MYNQIKIFQGGEQQINRWLKDNDKGGLKMTIQQQIGFLIYLSIFSIPIMLTYFFFPEPEGSYDKVEKVTIILVSIIVSSLFFGFIFLLTTFIKVFPLLGIPTLVFMLYKLYKNWKKIASHAMYNYNKYHIEGGD